MFFRIPHLIRALEYLMRLNSIKAMRYYDKEEEGGKTSAHLSKKRMRTMVKGKKVMEEVVLDGDDSDAAGSTMEVEGSDDNENGSDDD